MIEYLPSVFCYEIPLSSVKAEVIFSAIRLITGTTTEFSACL
jgi:hypothetical protein